MVDQTIPGIRDYVNEHFRQFYPADAATAWRTDRCGGGYGRRYDGTDQAASNIFPYMHLADGTRLSVQGHFGAYSWPRDDFAEEDYSQVEILGPDLPEFAAYRGDKVDDEWLYAYVPVAIVNALIEQRGGIAPNDGSVQS